MTTGVSSFVDPYAVGPLYPGVGTEWFVVLIGFVLWLLWHVWQISSETKEYDKATKLYKEVGMERAMHHATGRVATEEEMKAAEVQKELGRRFGH